MFKKPPMHLALVAQAVAVMVAVPLAAHAERTITPYGVIDIEMAKFDGQTYKTETTGSTSRLGVKMAEDLNYGLKGVAQLEHQFNPDDGSQYNSSSFFSGRATLGVEGAFGRLLFGRDVNPSHYVESAADPFTQDGMAGGYGERGGISRANSAQGAIDTVRMSNSINYTFSAAGLTFRAQTAARENTNTNGNKPYSASLIYQTGALQVGVSYLNPATRYDHWAYASATYDFQIFKLFAGYGTGDNTFNQQIRNQFFGASAPVGLGLLKASFSRTTSAGTEIQAKSALGYYFPLSTNFTVYSDVVYDSHAAQYVYNTTKGWTGPNATVGKNGYDVGLKYVF